MTSYLPPPGAYRPTARDSLEHPAQPLAQLIGAILWPSFFAAGVATTVFFAVVDPQELNRITWADLHLSRQSGYTLGFFMFWLCTAGSSLFTWVLLRPGSRYNQPLPPEQ